MRLPLTLLTSLALTAPALAGPLDGRWAFDLAICANQPGSGDVTPVVIAGNEITAYESGCTIDSLEPIGSMEQAWKAKLSCSGEGETYASEVIYGLIQDTEGRATTLVQIDMSEGQVIGYRNCDNPG